MASTVVGLPRCASPIGSDSDFLTMRPVHGTARSNLAGRGQIEPLRVEPSRNDGHRSSRASGRGEREPIAVFRVDGVVEGWIPKQQGRISDGLNDADHMRVGTETADGSATDWLEFSLDDVIAVAPAPRPVSPQRVSRRRHPMEVEAGPYRVIGTVHLPIGADPRRYVVPTGRRWLPLPIARFPPQRTSGPSRS